MNETVSITGISMVDPLAPVVGAAVWELPAGTTAVLEIDGDPAGVPELDWSVRCAEIPATRAVVLLDGPGAGDAAEDFTSAHVAAERVAEWLGRGGVEVGPIEVLVLRPDVPRPEPVETTTGVQFRFRHHGGVDVHLTLTLPMPPGED